MQGSGNGNGALLYLNKNDENYKEQVEYINDSSSAIILLGTELMGGRCRHL